MKAAILIAAILAASLPVTALVETPEPETVCRSTISTVKTCAPSKPSETTETVQVLDYFGTYEVETPYIPPKAISTIADAKAYIFDECAKRDLDPWIVLAMVHHESRWNAESIGDSGRAFGLMQIQPRWHEERMEKLEITTDDLLDPVKNVTVGIDFFDELMDMDKGLDWALMCYNGGPAKANRKANISYANNIKNTAAELAEK